VAETIVALDRPTSEEALALVDELGPGADFSKVGLELFTREGPAVVRALRDRGHRIFLDLKLHDIPHTVARAVRSMASLGVELLTVHTAGGGAMMEAAAEAAAEARSAQGASMRVVGVTVLTSLDSEGLAGVWGRPVDSVRDEVVRLAGLARASGLDGVVSSAREAASLRSALGPEALLVTPGIRLAGDDPGDQKRVMTPGEAAAAGADYLVIGRTVTAAPDPARALERVRAELDGASNQSPPERPTP